MARHAAPEQQTSLSVLSENATLGHGPDAGYAQRVDADLVQGSHPVMEGATPEALARVRAFRGWIQELPKEQKEKLEEYVRQFYDDNNRPIGRHGSHVDWLAEGAAPEEVLDWKERQAFEVQAQQYDPEVQERIARVRELTAERYAEYVEKGRLAKVSVLSDPVAAIKNTRVLVGDMRTTRLWNNRGYWSGGDQVVVAQGHTGTTEERTASLLREMDETLPHELLHAARLGDFLPGWAMEGIAEHVTDAFAHGEADVLYPDNRHKSSYIYLSQRRLLGALQLGGSKEIDTPVMTRALSSSGYDSPEFQELDDQLYESWMERGKFQRVSGRVAEVERELTQKHPDWHPVTIQGHAAQRVSEELTVQGVALRQRLHELGNMASGQQLNMSIAGGVASVHTHS